MSINPKRNETSIQALYRAWKAGVSKKTILISFGDLIPQIVASLFGLEAAYWRSHKKHGWKKVTAPHNVWRSVCHAIQGFFMALIPAYFLHFLVPVIGIFLFAIFMEFLDVRRAEGKIHLKNIVDVLDRTAGSLVAVVLIQS